MNHERTWWVPVASLLASVLLAALTGSPGLARTWLRDAQDPTEKCKTTLEHLSVTRPNLQVNKAKVQAQVAVTPKKATGKHTLKLTFYDPNGVKKETTTQVIPDSTASGQFKLEKEIGLPDGTFGVKVEYSFTCDPDGAPSTGVATTGIVGDPPDLTPPPPPPPPGVPLVLGTTLTAKLQGQNAQYSLTVKVLNNVGAVTARIVVSVEFQFNADPTLDYTDTTSFVDTDPDGVFKLTNKVDPNGLPSSIKVVSKVLAVDAEGKQGFDTKTKEAP